MEWLDFRLVRLSVRTLLLLRSVTRWFLFTPEMNKTVNVLLLVCFLLWIWIQTEPGGTRNRTVTACFRLRGTRVQFYSMDVVGSVSGQLNPPPPPPMELVFTLLNLSDNKLINQLCYKTFITCY